MASKRSIKKQKLESIPVKSAAETPTPSEAPEVPPVAAPVTPQPVTPATPEPVAPEATAAEPVDPLMAEVESFLNKRDELARRIADEIAATEEKLAELKKTAASLFPESLNSDESIQKPKKPKPKPASKADASAASEGQ